MKTILIAIPTNKYIEPETFKAIYDLEVPEGYQTHFQYFFGYQVDQIRNLIASWAIKFDYLFAVDSDMSFPSDTLKKLLSHNKEIVSGVYRQRNPDKQIIEIFNLIGGHVDYSEIEGKGLVEVFGCGFGCVLLNSEVFRKISYPQFLYKSALDHKDTFSEDAYFFKKVREQGIKIFVDSSILCGHHGNFTFTVQSQKKQESLQNISETVQQNISVIERYHELSNMDLLPIPHVDYLKSLDIKPKVIYDIGACVLHWTKAAKKIWTESQIISFDAVEEMGVFYKEQGVTGIICLLGKEDRKIVDFYNSVEHPGGNTVYEENEFYSPNSRGMYMKERKVSFTLDTIVKDLKLPLPELIKMDVQGSEMDILIGAQETLKTCNDLILELQKVNYNQGAPMKDEVIEYITSLGFRLVCAEFSDNGPDGDYHFSRTDYHQ
jgi:FkbM family methyltransferase